MGWEGVTIMDQRVRFIAEHLRGYFPFKELCLQFGISRKTGYKWVDRYEQEGSGVWQIDHGDHTPVPMSLMRRSLKPLYGYERNTPLGGRRSSLRSLLLALLICLPYQPQPTFSNGRVLSTAAREDSAGSIPDVRRPSLKSPMTYGLPITRATSR